MKRMNSRKSILTLLVLLCAFSVFADTNNVIPDLITRKDVGYQGPDKNTIMQLPVVATLKPSGKGNMDKNNVQNAVNRASEIEGGRIVLTAGTYHFSDINVKSNVHFYFKEGVEVTPLLNGEDRQDIFIIGRNEGEEIQNVTFIGEGDKQNRPLFRYDHKIAAQARLFSNHRIVNLYIYNLSISDEQTKFSGITFHPQHNGQKRNHIAKNVSIINCSITDASYGYGLVQANVGENMWLKDLEATGGVCARIETHTGRESNLGVYNVVIEDIKCYHGKAAVSMQPHVVANGIVTVNGVYAECCQWGVMIKDGFVSKKLDTTSDWTPGSFAKGSKVSNVHVIHCDSSCVSNQDDEYIPNELYYMYKQVKTTGRAGNAGKTDFVGPSIGAILNLATDEVEIDTATVFQSGDKEDERLLIVSEKVVRNDTSKPSTANTKKKKQ